MPSRNSNKANDGIRRARWNVRDRKTGATTLVSVNSAGTASGNSASARATISADGRVVAFQSFATDPVAYGTSGFRDVFVRDLRTGTTTLASVNRAGTGSGNGPSGDFFAPPLISADGRVVAFESLANDLVANDTNGTENLFVRIAKR